MSEPIADFVLRHPELTTGKEDEYYLIVTFATPLAKLREQGTQLLQGLMQIEGLEGADRAGRYSIGIGIARTFNPEQVKSEIKEVVEAEVAAANAKIITLDKKIVTP